MRKVLEIPHVYNFFQTIIQRKSIWEDTLEHRFGSALGSLRILDIGCGPGGLLTVVGERLDRSKFTGIDPSPDYIRRAYELFPDAFFQLGTVATCALPERSFDLIVISGVLHHVEDDEAKEIMKFADNHIADNGTIITVDPVFFAGQNFFAKWMAQADRGQNVRTAESLQNLWGEALPNSKTEISIKSGYLRVPYNHVVCIITQNAVRDVIK